MEVTDPPHGRLPALARQRRAFTKATAGPATAGVAAQGILFVSGVLAARLLGPQDRGHFALLYLIPLGIVLLGGAGVPSAVPYYVARQPTAARAIIRRLAPIAAAQLGVLLAVHVAVLEFAVLPRYPAIRTAALLSLATTPAALVQQYAIALLQGLRRFKLFNVLRLLPAGCYSLAMVVLFTAHVSSLEAVMGVWAASAVIGVALSVTIVWLVRPRVASGAAPPPVSQVVRFGLRGLLGAVSPVDDLQVDQILVGLLLSARSLGFYVAALALTNLPRLVAQSIGLVLYPQVAAGLTRQESIETLRTYLILTIPLIVAIVAGLELIVGVLLPLLFGDDFRPAVPLARLLLAASLFFCLRRLLSDGARGLGHPAYGAIAEAVSLAVLLPVALGLSRVLGTDGVAIATMASSASAVVLLAGLILRTTKLRLPSPACSQE